MDLIFDEENRVRIVGSMTVRKQVLLPVGVRLRGIRFRPGRLASFLKMDACELVDKLQELRTFPLEEWLQRSCVLTPGQRALDFLAERHGNVDLDWVAGQAGLSVRHFRRVSLERTGLSPKHLARVLRFRRAQSLRRHSGTAWSALAVDCGYYDQAHLIRDWREFTGMSPMAEFSNRAAEPSD
nr:AraC family transcriptional regulator [Bryobacter aggregatus]